MKIVWTKIASRHLHAAYEYWSRERSEDAADIMLDRILSTVELLECHPELGRQGRISSTRELLLQPLPFFLAYRVKLKRVEILGLLHCARKWPPGFD